MIKKTYDTFILKYPILVLLLLSLFVSILGYYSTKVEVDASAETLLLDDDKDLKFFREINKRYNNSNFLIVTFTPHENLLSNESLETIKNLSKEFLTVENIENVEDKVLLSVIGAIPYASNKSSIRELYERGGSIEIDLLAKSSNQKICHKNETTFFDGV